MARIYPATKAQMKRAPAPPRRRPGQFAQIDPISDRLFALDKHEKSEPVTYKTRFGVPIDQPQTEPVEDFGGGEISQSFKGLLERLMGLSNGLSVLAQRISVVTRPEAPSNATKDTAGPSASSAVARALQQLDRNVEAMQVQIDSLTERIVL